MSAKKLTKFVKSANFPGLCSTSSLDQYYGWVTEKQDIRGFTNTALKFDNLANNWKLTLYDNPNIYAIFNETNVEIPFGKHFWYVFNDTCEYDGHHGREEKLLGPILDGKKPKHT